MGVLFRKRSKFFPIRVDPHIGGKSQEKCYRFFPPMKVYQLPLYLSAVTKIRNRLNSDPYEVCIDLG